MVFDENSESGKLSIKIVQVLDDEGLFDPLKQELKKIPLSNVDSTRDKIRKYAVRAGISEKEVELYFDLIDKENKGAESNDSL